jgi:subtilase family serine protease
MGGIGAIAIVDAGYYPTAQADMDAFDAYFGIPATTITQVWPGTTRPPVYSGWEVEEALAAISHADSKKRGEK